jgi:superfamily II DNA or RNA helicase
VDGRTAPPPARLGRRARAPRPARAAIGRALADPDAPHAAGPVALHQHQRAAVARLRAIIAEHGGALLADEVGLGKSHVAATIARDAARPLVVVPAALRGMWRELLAATGVRAPIVSYEALSRGAPLDGDHDLLVLDEAHHARNRATRRWRRLAELAARARVLLLSATPIHNRRDELVAALALFLGERATTMGDAELARLVVRRERGDVRAVAPLPDAAPPAWLPVGDDERTVAALLALPPPLPPRDGGDGGALLAWSLVRQWASSRGALEGALRRRLGRAAALAAAVERGRHPSRAELAAWSCADHAVQLAFPELVAAGHPDGPALLDAVRAHERAVRALLRDLAGAPDPDEARAARLREIRARHPGERIVAFSQYADTVEALYLRLRGEGGVAMLAGRGARVAGGALSRRALLRRFAPTAHGATPPRPAEHVELLLATDLLSEGVDLRDATVVVHLDLPWTPARMEQRVGRSRRLGATHATTTVYALAPPASTESLLAVERRLRVKLRHSARLLGVAGAILPSLAPSSGRDAPARDSPVRAAELLRERLEAWAREADCDAPLPRERAVLVAAVAAPARGALALLRAGDLHALGGVAADGEAGDDPALLLALARAAEGDPREARETEAREALESFERMIARRRAALDAGVAVPIGASAGRRRALRRIAAIAARAPRDRRPAVAAMADLARRAALARCGAGAEAVLGRLATAAMADEAWLRAMAAFAELHAPASAPNEARDADKWEPAALLLLVPDE